eukprot:TRINITY_DN27403_c0_g1_i1.p1 TRINITY_DN27403_c0_g1~~TRINITY_DN27403_c0_g1_i1.p1  ORF type:complete len:1075 (+),score=111.70 TRINITY_DN27403_c0_g1_i1:32-3256(+)
MASSDSSSGALTPQQKEELSVLEAIYGEDMHVEMRDLSVEVRLTVRGYSIAFRYTQNHPQYPHSPPNCCVTTSTGGTQDTVCFDLQEFLKERALSMVGDAMLYSLALAADERLSAASATAPERPGPQSEKVSRTDSSSSSSSMTATLSRSESVDCTRSESGMAYRWQFRLHPNGCECGGDTCHQWVDYSMEDAVALEQAFLCSESCVSLPSGVGSVDLRSKVEKRPGTARETRFIRRRKAARTAPRPLAWVCRLCGVESADVHYYNSRCPGKLHRVQKRKEEGEIIVVHEDVYGVLGQRNMDFANDDPTVPNGSPTAALSESHNDPAAWQSPEDHQAVWQYFRDNSWHSYAARFQGVLTSACNSGQPNALLIVRKRQFMVVFENPPFQINLISGVRRQVRRLRSQNLQECIIHYVVYCPCGENAIWECRLAEEANFQLATKALEEGNDVPVYRYLDGGLPINKANTSGQTLLMLAAWHSRECALSELIHRKAAIDVADGKGRTALMYACMQGHEGLVRRLLRAGANPTVVSLLGSQAIHLAAEKGAVEVVRTLLAYGASATAVGEFGTPLFTGSHSCEVARLLVEAGCDVKWENAHGYTALHWACHHGAEFDSQRFQRAVPNLLELGADVDARAPGGLTALHIACREGLVSVVAELLRAGADTRATSDKGHTPLVFTSSPIISAMLLPDCERDLLNAAKGDTATLAMLLRQKIDPNVRDRDMLTPIMLAALHGHTEGVRLLLAAGANPKLTTPSGLSAQLFAHWAAAEDVIQLLEASGALPTDLDQKGLENLMHWVRRGDPDVTEFLDLRSEPRLTTVTKGIRRRLGNESSLEERMANVVFCEEMHRFIPEDYAPSESLLRFLRKLGDTQKWKNCPKNPPMNELLWNAKTFVCRCIAEGSQSHPLNAFSLFVYTCESAACYEPNRAMREIDEAALEEWRPVIYYLVRALKAQSAETCLVFRGINCKVDVDAYLPGRVCVWPSFSSTSTSYKVARNFMKGERGTIFVCHTRSACSISKFSYFPEEEEMLLPPHTRWRVVKLCPVNWRALAAGDRPEVALDRVRDLDSVCVEMEEI